MVLEAIPHINVEILDDYLVDHDTTEDTKNETAKRSQEPTETSNGNEKSK